jgi:predicted MFS family arabinose efflux permease
VRIRASIARLQDPSIAGFLAVFVGHGVGRFAYPAMMPALVEQRWISGAQVGYLGAANLAGYLLGSFYGVRGNSKPRHIIPSLIAVAISYFGCALRGSIEWLFLWRFVAGVAAGIVITTAVPWIQSRPQRSRRAAAVATAFAGVGAGIVLTGATMPTLTSHGITFACCVLALFSLALTFASWPAWDSSPDDTISDATAGNVIQLYSGSRRTYLLAVSYAATAVAYVPYVVFWVDYIARVLHAGVREASICWILFGVATMLGPFLCATMASRMGTARALRWSLLVNAVAVSLPLAATHFGFLAASSIGDGAMSMGITALTATRVREISAPERYQAMWGGMTIVFAVAFAAGGWVFSHLVVMTHSYRILFWLSAAVLLAGTFAQLLDSRLATEASSDAEAFPKAA